MKSFKEKVAEEIASAVATNSTAGVASLDASDPTNPPVFKQRQSKVLNKLLKRRAPQ
jgi:hypothetical protein